MPAKRILVLEQEQDAGLIMQAMLRAKGHDVAMFASAAELLTELSRHSADIVITNRFHKLMRDGSPLPWLICSMQPKIALIVTLSIKTDQVELSPFDAVLYKPFTIEQLEEAIKKVLRGCWGKMGLTI